MQEQSSSNRRIRAVFFALTGALVGALCAADSNVTMTLIADAFAADNAWMIVDEFSRNGGGVRGMVGAVVGLCMGLGLFSLMCAPVGKDRDEPRSGRDWLVQ